MARMAAWADGLERRILAMGRDGATTHQVIAFVRAAGRPAPSSMAVWVWFRARGIAVSQRRTAAPIPARQGPAPKARVSKAPARPALPPPPPAMARHAGQKISPDRPLDRRPARVDRQLGAAPAPLATIETVDARGCRFLAGGRADVADRRTPVCGHPAMPGTSWCAHHLAVIRPATVGEEEAA